MSRRPYCNALVPTRAIDRRLARVHVGMPAADVERMVRDAIAVSPDRDRFTAEITRQTVRYALWRHERNRAEYVRVMSGRL